MSQINEETIYQITRVVYQHLGEKVERKLVENLVSDIFNAVCVNLPPTNTDNIAIPIAPPATYRFIVSVFGLDRPGIVAAVATLLGDLNCNLIDINQTVVQGKFAMIMIVDGSEAKGDISQLRDLCRQLGEKLGVRIYLQREDIFHAMHRV